MTTNITDATIVTIAAAPARPVPFPSRSPMYYCTTCEACSQMRLLLWAMENDRPDMADDERREEAAIDTEDLDCHCEHTTECCEFFNPEEHDDFECGTCNYADEDGWRCR